MLVDVGVPIKASASCLLSTFHSLLLYFSADGRKIGAKGVDSKPRLEDGIVLVFAWASDGVDDIH